MGAKWNVVAVDLSVLRIRSLFFVLDEYILKIWLKAARSYELVARRYPRTNSTDKLRLYMSLILSVLLYASETWMLTKANLDRLQAFHMSCQRQILGVLWLHKVTNTEIINRTKLPH